jgi:hypothetical protein
MRCGIILTGVVIVHYRVFLAASGSGRMSFVVGRWMSESAEK